MHLLMHLYLCVYLCSFMFKCMSLDVYVPSSLKINTMDKLWKSSFGTFLCYCFLSLFSLPRAPFFTDILDTYLLFYPFAYYKPHFLCKLNLLICSVSFHFLLFLSCAPWDFFLLLSNLSVRFTMCNQYVFFNLL